MTEIEKDAAQVLADTKSEIAKLESDAANVDNYVKSHIVWMIGLGCLLVGAAIGHLV